MDGKWKRTPAGEIVAGDIVRMRSGKDFRVARVKRGAFGSVALIDQAGAERISIGGTAPTVERYDELPALEQTVIPYPGPFSAGPHKVIGAMCADGVQRNATCSPLGADTFFSIPARVSAKGKTVAGYVSREDDVWTFHAYLYRANWHSCTPELEPSLRMDFRPAWRRVRETSTAAANTVAGALH